MCWNTWNYPETDVSRQFLLTKVKWQTMDALPCFWGQKDVFLSNVIILLTKEHNKVISFIFWSNKTSGPAVFVRSRCLSRWCSSHHCPNMFCCSTWVRSNVQCTYFQSGLTCSMNMTINFLRTRSPKHRTGSWELNFSYQGDILIPSKS